MNTNIKKIATITFHQAVNYGAVLQAYALQKTICELNYPNEILNYDCSKIRLGYEPFLIKKILHIKSAIHMILNFYIRWQKKRKFEKFISNNLEISALIGKTELPLQEEKYSLFIAGSDQVWNYNITNSDGSYFLDFINDNRKKCSYAASFGISILPKDKMEMYSNYLKNFNAISVREKSGANLVNNIVGRTAVVDLDPVFLLSAREWEKLCCKQEKISCKYILVYTVGAPDKVYQNAKNLRDKTGFKIINIKYNLSLRNKAGKIGDCLYTVGPEEFVNFLKNAEIIVTNSFHAVAFSIIFNKEFFVEINDNLSTRITDLLTSLNIDGRYFDDTISKKSNKIVWQPINDILESKKKSSIIHLKKILELSNR